MKKSIIQVIILILIIASPANGKAIEDGDIGPCGGTVNIIGKTNVGNFTLKYNFPKYIRYPISVGQNDNSTLNIFHLPVNKFVGESEQIKEDFLNLVRANEFPDIKLTFLNTKDLRITKQVQQINVEISIAGISRIYSVECSIEGVSSTQICLKGSKNISIKDFNLNPPVKFFGLIRVKEDIDIDFSVNFTESILTNTSLY